MVGMGGMRDGITVGSVIGVAVRVTGGEPIGVSGTFGLHATV